MIKMILRIGERQGDRGVFGKGFAGEREGKVWMGLI
jgi:hypothetical protein